MLIAGIALGLMLGLLLGGRLERLADIRLKFLPLLFLGVIVRFGTEAALIYGLDFADQLRLPLFGLSYGLLLFTLWQNRAYPGLALAFVGVASNALVIMVNGGYMPVWMPAYEASGLSGPLGTVLHVPLPATLGPEFLLRLGPLSDLIPLPIPPLQNVASIGDLFLTAGLSFFLFSTVLRIPDSQTRAAIDSAKVGRLGGVSGTAAMPTATATAPTATLEPTADGITAVADDAWSLYPPGEGVSDAARRAGTGLSPGLEESSVLQRPLILGGRGVGMAAPATSSSSQAIALDRAATTAASAAAATDIAIPGARPSRLEDARQHPYVRLALNGSFSALWVGQVISLFGDRINQLALIAFVFEITDSPVAVAITFLVSTIPNLIFSPVAGTLVDRWDQKQVLVVSDILRAALVLLVPVAVLINVWLAYPLVFLITTVSIFFRPARIAILPRIVEERDLLSANSAMWVGETIADVINYPIAGLFVVFLADSLALAFWFDAVTYLGSAVLLSTIVVPPLARRAKRMVVRGAEAADVSEVGAEGEGIDVDVEDGTEPGTGARTVGRDLRAGWRFLRNETVLLANTIQGTVGQFAVGVFTVSSIVLARELTVAPGDEYRATYAFMETAIGLGNLIGGFALGLITTRVRKGRLIIAAYVAFGALVFLVGNVSSVPLVLGLLFGVGVANMAFIIPSQTLFQERTPPEMMGRVVSFRFAVVFGGMSIAMAVGGLLTASFGPGPVIAVAGLISIVAGLSGLTVRALREA
jgi:DHA3 family macrolide efflux protein-like MFS transporter